MLAQNVNLTKVQQKRDECQLINNIKQVKQGIDRRGHEEHVGEPVEPLPPDLPADGSAALLTQPAPPHHARPQLPHERLRRRWLQLWGRQRRRWSATTAGWSDVRKVG